MLMPVNICIYLGIYILGIITIITECLSVASLKVSTLVKRIHIDEVPHITNLMSMVEFCHQSE